MKYISVPKLIHCVALVGIVVALGYAVWAVTAPQSAASHGRQGEAATSVNFSHELQQVRNFTLAEGRLHDQALKFSKQLSIAVGFMSYDPELRGNAVRGSYSIEEALGILLKDTGCERRDRKDQAMVIIFCREAPVVSDDALKPQDQPQTSA